MICRRCNRQVTTLSKNIRELRDQHDQSRREYAACVSIRVKRGASVRDRIEQYEQRTKTDPKNMYPDIVGGVKVIDNCGLIFSHVWPYANQINSTILNI